MAKRGRKSSRRWFGRKRRAGKRKISIAVVGGLAGTALGGHCDSSDTTFAKLQAGDFMGAGDRVITNFTGYSISHGAWDWRWINWEPLAAGIIVHMTLGRFANKYLKKVPYVNI